MKSILAPLITAVVLIDAATHHPIQYVNSAEATSAPVLDVKPKNAAQFEGIYQKNPAHSVEIEPVSAQPILSKPSTPLPQDDSIEPDSDESDDDEPDSVEKDASQESDVKPTSPEFIDAKQTSEPIKPETELDYQDDDELRKPAGIDFPDGEPTEKKFDHVEFKTTTNYTTSTVYATVTSTVTDCVSTVTDCSDKGSIVTKTISLYTTICPVTTPTSVTTPTLIPPPTEETDIPESDLPDANTSDSGIPNSDKPDTDTDLDLDLDEELETEPEAEFDPESESDPESDPKPELSDLDDSKSPESTPAPYLTKTIETTVWYTVTDCPPKQTECPIGLETSSISTRTEVYPVTDISHIYSSPNSTHLPYPYVTGSPSNYPEPPKTNVTVPTTPPNFTENTGSLYKANSFLMYTAILTVTVTALLQGFN